MNILLLGEYSGLYKNLKEGLNELGHSVDMASSGDGWKQIEKGNLKLFSNSDNRYINRLLSISYQLMNISKLNHYDVVQLVNPNIFGGIRYGYNKHLISKLKKNNNLVILSNAGNHYYNYKVVMEKLRYGYYQEPTIDSSKFLDKSYIRNNDQIIDVVDGIIPVMYTYAEAYRGHDKLLNTIQLPINVDKVSFSPLSNKKNKIHIFHGLNREDVKGTKYIVEAMNLLKERYPNDVEILIDGKMPLKKYLNVIEKTDIIVDQALSYNYGMNAIYSMAMGKVVLSGNELECQQEFQRDDIPIVNIMPNVEDIYQKLEFLVLNRNQIPIISEKSRRFVEDFHNHITVAQKYLDTWKSVGG